MRVGRRVWLVAAVTAITAALGCSSSPTQGGSAQPSPSGVTPNPVVTSTASVRPTPSPTTPSPPPHPVSLQALMQKTYDGRDLQVGRVLSRNSAYTRYFVTYRSGSLKISGIMNVPTGDGPFPVIVLAHGYIDPAIYTNGRSFRREQDYLPRHGYVVLHTDYRNHAQSDDDPQNELTLRLGYTEDVVNAVLAVKESSLPYLDGDRVGLLGRSMGGGVTLNALVVQPDLVDAAVVYSPVSSDAVDNFDRWVRGQPGRRALAETITRTYGSPEQNPAFWRNISAVSFFDKISEPVLVQHGTADETCPIQWSRETVAALQGQGKDVSLATYDGEGHTFRAAWPTSMRRTVAFFNEHLVAG